jgi:two-component system phosphate regulon sensor histidine kinase PhoR
MTNFPWKTFTRPVLVQIIVIALLVVIPALTGYRILKSYFLGQVEEQLADSITLISGSIPSTPSEQWCRERIEGTKMRLTLIRPEGKVICDSHESTTHMGSHSDRPEMQTALTGKAGISVRYSDTLHEDYIYVAKQAQGQQFVIRLSVSLHRLSETLDIMTQMMSFALIAIVVILSGFAIWTSRRLIYPLSQTLKKTKLLLNETQNLESGVNAAGTLSELTTSGIQEIADAPLGEWSDLDSSLEIIHRNLVQKSGELTRERQEQLALMSAINDAILAVDPMKNILFYNSRFPVLFAPVTELRGSNLAEIFRIPQVLELFDAALQKGQVATSNALPLGNGKKRYFSISVSPIKNHDGTVSGAISVFHDVTDLKLAEQMRIDFVANVSHELRTPLTSIKGYVDTLALDFAAYKDKIPEAWHEFLRVIIRNTARLGSLINDLLDLSALEASEPLIKSSLDTRELTERVLQKVAVAVKDKEHKITLNCEASQVYADPLRIEQVLTNLLDNAIKYTPQRGAIEISWRSSPDGKGTILTVSDNGPGIAPEHHARLFERFYRVDKGRSRELGGTGLGLAIVKHIVQLHQGSIGVKSEQGGGTQFTCIFPQS